MKNKKIMMKKAMNCRMAMKKSTIARGKSSTYCRTKVKSIGMVVCGLVGCCSWRG